MNFSTALIAALTALIVSLPVIFLCIIRHRYVRTAVSGAIAVMIFFICYPIITARHGLDSLLPSVTLTLLHTLEMFLMDGDYELARSVLSASAVSPAFAERYADLYLLLMIAAPAATATVILSYFSSVTAMLRLYVAGLPTNLYVFSELNEKSAILAEDVCRKDPLRTLVFYNVNRKGEGVDAALLDKVRSLGAITFEKDISALNAQPFSRKIEFFVIGGNESENISRAIRLVNLHGGRRSTRVYVWAGSSESECILDSLSIPADENPDASSFRLRRVNVIKTFAWNLLRDADLFSEDKRVMRDGRIFISALIVGMGNYGMELLKALVWMYQAENVRLEINVVDVRSDVQRRLNHDCPELLAFNDLDVPGEARYSIRFYENTDIFLDDFDRLLLSGRAGDAGAAARLQRTTAAFVTLGDDDANIRASLALRRLFDRAQYAELLGQTVADCADRSSVRSRLNRRYAEQTRPEIHTPVYDVPKSENITLANASEPGSACALRCYENIPYNIRFHGSFREQYSYDTVVREEMETEAMAYHLQWTDASEYPEARQRYNQYEYYRRSSMSQALHKRMIRRAFGLECTGQAGDAPQTPGGRRECRCEHCETARRIEHMRWNAYMRTEGFSHAPGGKPYRITLPRARMHHDLVRYDELEHSEKMKDTTI